MDTIMKNVAYKTMQNNPNLPNGFIIDHFETDDDVVPGYIVVDKNSFTQILENNVTLMRMHETNKGIMVADPSQPPHPVRPNEQAEPADVNMLTARQKTMAQNQADMDLFKQFMALKASQGSDSGSGSGSGS